MPPDETHMGRAIAAYLTRPRPQAVPSRNGAPAKRPVLLAGKTREQVRAELIAAQRAGNVIVNAELGLTARQLYPAKYAEETRGRMQADLDGAAK
jgi:hypothetical protein